MGSRVRRRRSSLSLGVASSGLALLALLACRDTAGGVRVYPARAIVTMDPARPTAGAVAVEDGRIAAVGTLAAVVEELGDRAHQIDRRFEAHVLMPGFIEPHLHPYIAGVLLPMHFVTPHPWQLPGRVVDRVRGQDAYLGRLREIDAALPSDEWLWTWGYHHLFHGKVRRAELDALSTTRPIVVWHRSFHEIILNTAAIEALRLDAEAASAHPQVDYRGGHFFETGLQFAVEALTPHLFSPLRYAGALREARDIIHRGGITTVSDGAFGGIDLTTERLALRFSSWNDADTPFRTLLLADGRSLGVAHGNAAALDLVRGLGEHDTGRLRFRDDAVKLFADGAFYSQLMQMGPPGYLDGHEGEWLMEPQALLEAARHYWKAGLQIHVHVNGDRGVDVALDVLDRLQQELPRDDHRYALHHFGYSRSDQTERIASLGAVVSSNPFYVWALADLYSEVGLGPQRASEMVRGRSLVDAGISLSFHSDFTMAPAEPLRLAWVAANRVTSDGNTVGPHERVPLPAALRGITIEAARLLRMEDEIGSIEVGKRADFTVLKENPLEWPVEELKDIPIWGTVFEGEIYRIEPRR